MPLFLINLVLQTFKQTFLSNFRFEFINQNHNQKLHSCRKYFDWKTIDIAPWIKTLIVWNFKKVVTKNDSSRLSKRCFSVNTGSISLMRVTISNRTLRKKTLDSNFNQLVFASKSKHSHESKVIFYWQRRYSISLFFTTTCLISTNKFWIENCTLVKEGLIEKPLRLILASYSWLCKCPSFPESRY